MLPRLTQTRTLNAGADLRLQYMQMKSSISDDEFVRESWTRYHDKKSRAPVYATEELPTRGATGPADAVRDDSEPSR